MALADLDAALGNARDAVTDLLGPSGDPMDPDTQIAVAFGRVMGPEAIATVAQRAAERAAIAVMAAQLAPLVAHLDAGDDDDLDAIHDIADDVIARCAAPVMDVAAAAALGVLTARGWSIDGGCRAAGMREARAAVREIESDMLVPEALRLTRRADSDPPDR